MPRVRSGSAAGLLSRYAAADLAAPDRRGRSLATVVWATTVGSVLGPNLAQPMGDLATGYGVPRLAGPYMLTVAAFLAAEANVKPVLITPPQVEATERVSADGARLLFILNHRRTKTSIALGAVKGFNLLTGGKVHKSIAFLI